VCAPVPSLVVKNWYVTVPVGVKPAGVPDTVAVSRIVAPRGTANGEMMGVWLASTITVADVDVPCWTVKGSTALVAPE
jgi:hypothetical protein